MIPLKLMSMTGFGKGAASCSWSCVDVEIKSVNNRFLDLVFKLPKSYQIFEAKLRKLINNELNRGRIDFTVNRILTSKEAYSLQVNKALFDSFMKSGKSLLEEYSLLEPQNERELFFEALKNKDIVALNENGIEVADEWPMLEKATMAALKELVTMRAKEGEALRNELVERVTTVESLAKKISNQAQSSTEQIKLKLEKRLKNMAGDILNDPARLYLEVGILVDKLDITEELARLNTHHSQFNKALKGNEQGSGRQLDFLLQEFMREFNTIASKAQDGEIQALAVQAKVEIERLREQVQNVE